MVTSSATASTSSMPCSQSSFLRSPSSLPQSLDHAQLIDAVAAGIGLLIRQVAHEMQAHAADFAWTACEIRRGRGERIERLAVVFHNRFDVPITQGEAHGDLMMRRILVAVGNDIIEDFVKRHVQGDVDLVRGLVESRYVGYHFRHPCNLGQVVGDAYFKGCRQSRLRRNRRSGAHHFDKNPERPYCRTHYSSLSDARHRRQADAAAGSGGRAGTSAQTIVADV